MAEASDREGALVSQVSLAFSLQQHIQADRKTNKQADSLMVAMTSDYYNELEAPSGQAQLKCELGRRMCYRCNSYMLS